MAEGTPAAPAAPQSTGNIDGAPADGGDQAPDASGTSAAPPPPAPKRKLKVYGQEREVDEDVFHQYAQKGAMFDAQRQELNRAKAEHESAQKAWEERFKADPAAALRERGIDPDAWAADYIVNQHARKAETEEQKKLREAEEKLAKYESERAETEKQRQQQAVREAAKRREAELGNSFVAALKAGGIPEGPASWPFVGEMAKYQSELDDLDALVAEGRVTPEEAEEARRAATPEVLAKLALESVRNAQVAAFGKLRGPDLAAVMGDEWLNRAAEAWVMREEAKRSGAQAQTGEAAVAAGVQRPAAAGGNGQARRGDGTFAPSPSRERSAFEEITGIRR